jgi:hypothetical protein
MARAQIFGVVCQRLNDISTINSITASVTHPAAADGKEFKKWLTFFR